MDLFTPPSALCDSIDLILLIHAGGFTDGNKEAMDSYGTYFAQHGYFVGSMNYRLWYEGYADESRCSKLNKQSEDGTFDFDRAWYLALQDARAALRQFHLEMDKRGVPVRNAFVFGISAGAITGINLAMVDQEDIDTHFPLLTAEFGDLDASTPDWTLHYPVSVATVASVSGTIGDLRLIDENDEGNIVFFHSVSDRVVDYIQDVCLNQLNTLDGPQLLMDQIEVTEADVCYAMYYSIRGGHDIYSHFDREIRDETIWHFLHAGLSPESVEGEWAGTLRAYHHECGRVSNLLGDVPFELPGNRPAEQPLPARDKLIVSPNPATDFMWFEFDYTEYTEGTVYVFDYMGQQRMQYPIDVWQGSNFHPMDVSSLPPGHYFIQLRVGSILRQGTFIRVAGDGHLTTY